LKILKLSVEGRSLPAGRQAPSKEKFIENWKLSDGRGSALGGKIKFLKYFEFANF
jgi:hypothetical protein